MKINKNTPFKGVFLLQKGLVIYMKIVQKKKGITLIALVITIVIMLLLAGVAI